LTVTTLLILYRNSFLQSFLVFVIHISSKLNILDFTSVFLAHLAELKV